MIWSVPRVLRLGGDGAECGCEPCLGLLALALEDVLVFAGAEFKAISLLFVDGLQREFLLVVLEECTELEVVLRVEVRFHCYVVLHEFKELLLKLVDLLGHEEGVDEGEVRIGQVAVIPNLLSYQKGAKDERAPVSWLQRHLREGYQSIDVDQADDAAFWAEKEVR